jgi:hypothetical protein
MVRTKECSRCKSGTHVCINLNLSFTNNAQFGVASGLGLFPMTFDWSQIAYIGSPLVVPFWAAVNIVGGLVIVMWIVAPLMCTNTRIHIGENMLILN